jgi:hypothetical protein
VWNTPPSPIFGTLLSSAKGLVGKEVFTSKKSFSEDGVNYRVTRGLRTGQTQKSESIRTTLSDLDPQEVTSRVTGHFQSCFPDSRPVSRPVFPAKLSRISILNKAPWITIKLDWLIVSSKSSLLVWFLHVSLILIDNQGEVPKGSIIDRDNQVSFRLIITDNQAFLPLLSQPFQVGP